jgi:hypothetical protein
MNATAAIGDRRVVVCEWKVDLTKPSAQFSTRDYTVFHFVDPQPNTGRGGLSLIAALKRNQSARILNPMDAITLKSVPDRQIYALTLHSNMVIAELGFSGTRDCPKFEAWIYSDRTHTVHKVYVSQIIKAQNAVNLGTNLQLKALVQAELRKPLQQKQSTPAESINGAESLLNGLAIHAVAGDDHKPSKQTGKNTPKKPSKSVSFVVPGSVSRCSG